MVQSGKRVLIIGGGFGGVAAALELSRNKIPGMKISLISDRTHFEYYAALYRVVTGRSPIEVCIPMDEIFQGKNIEFLHDRVSAVDLGTRIAEGSYGVRYSYDYLVLALGAETSYMNIPGLREYSFGFKSITEALKLKRHIHVLFESCVKPSTEQSEKLCLLDFVVVGAGASGVELSGELAIYAQKLAEVHGVSKSLISIQLIDASDRILSVMPKEVSDRVAKRLRELGVNILVNRPMEREEIESVIVRGLKMKTETVIWTAGVKSNELYGNIRGLSYDKRGKVLVDEYLQAKNFKNVFAVGDGASTEFSGLAQTAIYDGKVAARNIKNITRSKPLEKYIPKKPYSSIPVGPGWAATTLGKISLYGYMGWILRRAADFRYFYSILPLSEAFNVFSSGRAICESCSICLPE